MTIDLNEFNYIDNLGIYVPKSTIDSIIRYLEYGCPPGGFVEAVLANDLIGSVGRADSTNIRYLKNICAYVKWNIDCSSWGSYEIVRKYINDKNKTYDNKD
jgi:hypothetical protein